MFISTITHGKVNAVRYSDKISLAEEKESEDVIFMSKELPAPEFETSTRKVANQFCKQFGINLADQQAHLKCLHIDYKDVVGATADLVGFIHVTRNEGGLDIKVSALGCNLKHPANELERRVNDLILHSEGFVKGEKAQGELPLEDKPAKKKSKATA